MQENNYCVYKHTSPSNKVYIGITCQKPEKRWSDGRGYKHNKLFTDDIERYGWDNFTHEVLIENLTRFEANQKEIELIAFYKSNQKEFGYNISPGGNCGLIGGSKKIDKIFWNKFKVIKYENHKYTILCLDCNKTFERTVVSNKIKTKCPFEVHCHQITYKGESHTVAEWSKILNVPEETIRCREKEGLDLVEGRVNKVLVPINCKICGKEFIRTKMRSKYCSPECHHIGLTKHTKEESKQLKRDWANEMNSRLCVYNGETLTFRALLKRFQKKGIEHPYREAKKYII